MGNLVTFRGSHLREPIGVSASSRRGPTLRINSGTSNAARWSHLRHIVFSTCRHHSSGREHVFLARLWRQRGRFSETASLSHAHCAGGIHWGPRAHRCRPAVANPVHWREWRHRRRDYILRAQFSARPARIPDAVGFCLVPMDPIAGLVGLRLVDFLSAYRRVGTEAGMSSVSSFAHLGGAAVGVVAWLIWRKEKPNDEARMSNVEGNDGIRMTK